MKKLRIAVLMGGPSYEHNVSLNTGKTVLKNLDKNKYFAKPVVISKTGSLPMSFKKLRADFNLAFIALHGEYGEDGKIQKILKKNHIPYTGSKAKASEFGMNKIKSSQIFKNAGLKVPDYFKISDLKNPESKVSKFGYPLVIKPTDRGSSVGLSIIPNHKKLIEAVRKAKKYSNSIIAQKYVGGIELTCGVIEIKGLLKALPPTEIRPLKRKFFDYYSKYTLNASREITPAPLPKRQIKKIQNIALKAHKALNASGYSRTDMILEKVNSKKQPAKIYVLEINTLPGLTPVSLLPKAAKAAGINFSKLLDYIIEAAAKKS